MSEESRAVNSSPERLPWNVKLLGMTSLLNDIATEMAFPVIPLLLAILAPGEKWIVGLVEGVADTVAAMLKLFSGNWSDRLDNRRGFVLVGYGLAAVARPFIGVASAAWQVVVVRTLDRVGKGLRASPRDALIAESTAESQRGRAFGFHQAMDHLGAAIGPLLSFLFLWQFPGHLGELFFLTAIPGIAIMGLLFWGLEKPSRKTRAGKTLRLTLQPFSPRFKRFLGCILLFTLGNSSDMVLLQRAGELQISMPLLWCAFNIAKSIGNLLCGPLVDRRGAFKTLLVGWALYGFAYAGFAAAQTAWLFCAVVGVYALHFSLSEPAEKTLAVQLAGPERKGLALGWFNFTVGIFILPANLLTGWLYQVYGPQAAFATCALFALAATAALATLRPAEE
ncbi:MAG TPA: MFS transporter [Pirellulales bacterium]|jgi:MFS family permease|nr:MFS transporter [Pirellulales bacterium]